MAAGSTRTSRLSLLRVCAAAAAAPPRASSSSARNNQRPLSSTAQQRSEQHAQHEFDLVPGTSLTVRCVQPGAGVSARNGPHDRLSISGSTSNLTVQQNATTNEITAVVAGDGGGSGASPAVVSVQLPSRFCGLTVVTAGGGVEVAGQTNEAPLDIRSNGGAFG